MLTSAGAMGAKGREAVRGFDPQGRSLNATTSASKPHYLTYSQTLFQDDELGKTTVHIPKLSDLNVIANVFVRSGWPMWPAPKSLSMEHPPYNL